MTHILTNKTQKKPNQARVSSDMNDQDLWVRALDFRRLFC